MSIRDTLVFEEMQILDRGTVLVIGEEGTNQRLMVQRGAVWLTSTPAKGDVVLEAGDDYWFSSGAPWVLQCLEDAVLVNLKH